MRFKTIFTSVISTVMLVSTGGKLVAQVAPAARVGGRAIGIGAGFSDYDLDYGPGRRMQGLVARASIGIFHGLGIDVNARTIFMDTPPQLTRMQQNTFLAGAFYEAPPIWRVRPFARFAGGLGTIEFPSGNPLYTRDSYTVYAPSAGVEYPIVDKVYVRAEYEYQFWKEYHGGHYLNPKGVTLGVTYYLRGMHVRPHPMNQLSQ
jgi:opacity protein-like surface antigen